MKLLLITVPVSHFMQMGPTGNKQRRSARPALCRL